MVKDNKIWIFVAILAVVAIFYFGNQIGLFSVYGNNLQFGYSIYADEASGITRDLEIGQDTFTCTSDTCIYSGDQIMNMGGEQKFDYSVDRSFGCTPTSGGYTCHTHVLSFDITNKDATVSAGKTYIPPYLNFYFYSTGKSSDSSQYPKIYYSLNTPFTCDSNGCSGQLIRAGRASNPLYKYTMDLSSLINTPNIDHIYVGTYTYYADHDEYSYLILDIQPNIVLQSVCTEGEIKQIANEYFVCKNKVFVKAYVTDLTPEQQAQIIAQINALSVSIQEKANIIANLTSNLEGQLIMINQLQLDTAQKATIIKQLSNNITYQAQLIAGMQLTVKEQAATIANLTTNINTQATMINQLTTNLATKAALVSQLTVTNEQQAQLITAMSLSFAQQAGIINQLNNTINDDAQVIKNLNLNIVDQANLITQLRLERDRLAQLVDAMNLSNSDTATLINNLNLKISDQVAIISQLNLSLSQEQDLVNQLKLTIEQQNSIIEDLRNNNIPSEGLNFDNLWADYKWFIIGIGGFFLILLLFGGKKR